MTCDRLMLTTTLSVLLLLGPAHANLLDKAKDVAAKVGEKAKDTARGIAKVGRSVAFAAKSLTDAAIYGVKAFPKGVPTVDLLTPAREAQCPGLGARVNGCSVPLYDLITKRFKKLLEPACTDHDVCYNLTDAKQACDVAFRDRMYKLCDTLSVQKTLGLCRVAAHTWFAAVAHSDESLRRFVEERKWSKATCKPVPELTARTVRKR